ncbi:FtsX-like permease family protein [Nocardia huaxiensis]|uniref:FtsX-like permease family protein n=1 Tax=Nocardia huaxiensis TaxID=2755382 RepID=A0A7D6ZKX7_9NOCA|nr:FtsX-like permease family protein [Nocardia huaxiensis]QLY33699.1 FtsX-like permease family protein [Nocardia huaxiensis]UFS99379.1 FtsX-like permease family protein [Nocardia huaxiensis]
MIALWDRLRLFTVREFATHWGRTAATTVVVAVAAALTVAVLGLSGSLTGSVDRLTSGLAGTAALEVSGVTDAGFPQTVRAEVAQVPGVATAVPMLRTSVGQGRDRTLVLGVDPSGSALDSSLQSSIQGDAVAALTSVRNGVLVGPGVDRAKGEVFQLGQVEVTVAAVLDDERAARLNGGLFVAAPLPLAQKIAGRAGQLDSVLIVAAPGTDVAQLRSAVNTAVAGRALVADPSARAAQSGNSITMMRFMSVMSATIAVAVAAFLVYNVMSMSLAQRRPVVSMLRAIGGRKQTIVRDVLAEAALLGLVGGTVGALIGIQVGKYAVKGLPPAVVQMVDARLEYLLPWYAVPVAIVASVVTSVGASAMASRQVYRVSPVEALAPVGVSRADAVSRGLRIVAAVGAVAMIAAAVVVARSDLGLYSAVALGFTLGAQICLAFLATGLLVGAAAALTRRFGAAGVLAAVNIERAPRRVWATLMTITIAVSLTVTVTASNDDAVHGARDTFASLADNDFWVATTPADMTPTELLPPDALERAAAVPGVAKVVEGQMAWATFGGTKALVYGVTSDGNVPIYRALSAESARRVAAGDGVVFSRDMARNMQVTTGDRVTVQTPKGAKQIEVVDIVPYFSALGGTVAMSLTLMRDWFERSGNTTLQIHAQPGTDLGQLRGALEQALPPGLHVYSGEQALDGISSSIKQAMALARAMMVIVAFIAATALLNTLMLALLERRRELGILRAVGSSRKFALRMILLEAAGIGLVGATLGLVLGLINEFVYTLLATDMLGVEITARPGPILLVFTVAALVLSLLGSIPPALRAARLEIVDAVSAD